MTTTIQKILSSFVLFIAIISFIIIKNNTNNNKNETNINTGGIVYNTSSVIINPTNLYSITEVSLTSVATLYNISESEIIQEILYIVEYDAEIILYKFENHVLAIGGYDPRIDIIPVLEFITGSVVSTQTPIILMRGLDEDHHMYNFAVSGTGMPNNPYGTCNPKMHNAGSTKNSRLMSWTWNPAVAYYHATSSSIDGFPCDGIILVKAFTIQELMARAMRSPDIFSEDEILIKDIVDNCIKIPVKSGYDDDILYLKDLFNKSLKEFNIFWP